MFSHPLIRRGLPAVLLALLALPAGAQSFRVQCPTSTITHPNANNNAEPAYTGATTFTPGAHGYLTPATHVNGAIKCQQISGGDGYATMGDGTQTYLFGFGPLSGLWDIATPLGLEKHEEDFGQTLGWWGTPPGPYFVIPLLGPSTARDAPARLVDPSWYYAYEIGDNRYYWSWWMLDKVRARANLFRAEGVLEQAALDRYTFIRDAWLQRRRNQVFDGHPPPEKEEE